MNNHKVTIPNELLDQESALQNHQRNLREASFSNYLLELKASREYHTVLDNIVGHATSIGYEIRYNGHEYPQIIKKQRSVRTQKASVRDKQISYAHNLLPEFEKGKSYAANKVIESAMRVMAKDHRIVSIDSDLASTSGLQAGVGFVDKYRALNVGVAEANMMLIGEAFAALGYNTWISTFCPFFDWKVLRRIAVGQQERLEVIAANGWLSEGHGLDLTLLATAADLETQANGATHMGNDDLLLMNEAAHVKIINACCPQQLLAIMRWIMEGNKGIIYLRVLRAPATVLYNSDYRFEFGKANYLKFRDDSDAHIVTSGRGVHEALAAAYSLEVDGFSVNVIDMPSIDDNAFIDLYRTEKPLFIVEQNNGYLFSNFRRIIFDNEVNIHTRRVFAMNTTKHSELQYIHSGTYAELAGHFNLDSVNLSKTISKALKTIATKAETV